MRNSHRNRHLNRAAILKMLSDEDAGNVCNAESAGPLGDGDVYVDLTRLEQGVRRARGDTTPLGPVLPKKAVPENTWKSFVQQLAVLEGAARKSKT
jgi:hypothetical protein